jgi:hypothetical protein
LRELCKLNIHNNNDSDDDDDTVKKTKKVIEEGEDVGKKAMNESLFFLWGRQEGSNLRRLKLEH